VNPSVERFTGFAQVYDQVRPSPPEAIADLLLQFAKLETAERVVDLGCGSGPEAFSRQSIATGPHQFCRNWNWLTMNAS